MQVPFVDLKRLHANMLTDIDLQIKTVISQNSFILGPQVEDFEKQFANFCVSDVCVGVSSGTEAIYVALKALGIGPGDEVITVANTYIATVLAIIKTGATPILVDSHVDTDNIDVALIEKRIGPKTKCILPVHLYGRAVDMGKIVALASKYGLYVVEDCAQAHDSWIDGKHVGTFGDFGCFSFYPGKNLGAFGDGGCVITSDPLMASKVQQFRNLGSTQKYVHDAIGWNSRLDSVQAAVLTVKLKELSEMTASRQRAAAHYSSCFEDVKKIRVPYPHVKSEHSYHLYVIKHERRDALLEYLERNGVGCGIHYPTPIHKHLAFANHEFSTETYSAAEKSCQQSISLPIFYGITNEEVEYVVETVRNFCDLES